MTTNKLLPNKGASNWCPETSWTRIGIIQGGGEGTALSRSLEDLCSVYLRPILTAFRYKHNFTHEDAEDAAQDFLVWFLNSKLIDNANAASGKFRSYLLTCLDNFARNRRRKLQREKGGNQVTHRPIHPDTRARYPGIEIASVEEPLFMIHWDWGRATLDAARKLLKDSEIDQGNEGEWKILSEFLSIGSSLTLDEAASKLGISKGALKARIHRLRKRFQICLSEVVSATVSNEADFYEEMAFLRDIYS